MTNVNYLFNLLSNNYIGITFEFGLELYNVFIKSRNIDPSNKNNDMIVRKMQYFIAGFIADNWNIDCRLGPSTYCYFGHFNPIQKYNENRDLVLMGGYVQGQDPDLDQALALWPQILKFLHQDENEVCDFDASHDQLAKLLGV